MKIAHYDEKTKKLLGWYDKDIHKEIPTPNIEVTDEVWQEAIDKGFNKVNEDGTLSLHDFITEAEILEQSQITFRKTRDKELLKADIEISKLIDNDIDSSVWRTYRQSLRDATDNWVMPSCPV